jgi:hypothetical protein
VFTAARRSTRTLGKRKADVHGYSVVIMSAAAFFVSQPLYAQGPPEIESAIYVPLGRDRGAPWTNGVTQIGPSLNGRWGRYEVVATVVPRSRDEFFVLATADAIVAPRVLPTELRDRDVTKEVSWGVIASSHNLESRVLRGVPDPERKRVRVFILDVDRLLLDSFSDRDETLWPWAVRTTVRLLNRHGKVLSVSEAVLRITPKTP